MRVSSYSLGSSEGSPYFEATQRLAQEGYETFVLFMFGRKNQPQTLARIPLEQFDDVRTYLDKHSLDQELISIVAISKGAKYALNLTDKYSKISNLILIAASSYNFSGLRFKTGGSFWIYQGEELAYIDIKKSSLKAFSKSNTPLRIRNLK